MKPKADGTGRLLNCEKGTGIFATNIPASFYSTSNGWEAEFIIKNIFFPAGYRQTWRALPVTF